MDDDELTAEEQSALDSLALDNTAPPPEDEDGLDAAAPPAGDAAAVVVPPAVVVDPAAAPAETDDAKFEAFRAQHAGKTPDEVLRIAFQQERRATRTAFDARRATEERNQVVARATSALEARKAAIADKRSRFDQQLEQDPDAATRALAHQRFDEEERAAEAEATRVAHEARLDEAFELAYSAIPDLQTKLPEIYAFGGEMNYSPEELKGIADGRDLVTLYLASLAGNLIKGGLMDTRGTLVAAPPSVEATDPRLTAPAAVRTLSSAPARAADVAKSPEQALQDVLGLSDADFDKLTTEDLIRLTGG